MPSDPESKMENSQCRKIDRKYLAAALLILLLLITAGIIQLFPPETAPEAPRHHYANNLLILDMMEEEALKNTPNVPQSVPVITTSRTLIGKMLSIFCTCGIYPILCRTLQI